MELAGVNRPWVVQNNREGSKAGAWVWSLLGRRVRGSLNQQMEWLGGAVAPAGHCGVGVGMRLSSRWRDIRSGTAGTDKNC